MAQTRTYTIVNSWRQGADGAQAGVNAWFQYAGPTGPIPGHLWLAVDPTNYISANEAAITPAYIQGDSISFTDDNAIPSTATSIGVQVIYYLQVQPDSPVPGTGLPITPYLTDGANTRRATNSFLYGPNPNQISTSIQAIPPDSYFTPGASGYFTADAASNPFTTLAVFAQSYGLTSYGAAVYDYTHPATEVRWLGAAISVRFTLPVPGAVTQAASEITTASARLNGTIDPLGATSTYPVSYSFEYGPTAGLGSSTGVLGTLTGSPGATPVSFPLGSLTPTTTYYYRLVATTDDGPAYGATTSFLTASTDVVLMVF